MGVSGPAAAVAACGVRLGVRTGIRALLSPPDPGTPRIGAEHWHATAVGGRVSGDCLASQTDTCRSVAVRCSQQIPDAAPGQDMAWCARVVAETVAESPHGIVHQGGLVLVLRAPHAPQQLLV